MDAVLTEIAQRFGTPCFVYFMDEARERVQLVRAAFGDRFRISYAVKSNPNPGVLRRMRSMVDALDVSSAGEIEHAVESGWQASNLGFTGPGKTEEELRRALRLGVGEVVVESVDEARLLDHLAGQMARRQRVLIRISPSKVPRGFGLNMSGRASQFGIDEEDIDPALRVIADLPNLELVGLHIYSGTQCLKADAIVENYAIFIDLFRRVCHAHGLRPQRLVFGAGIGVPTYESDSPIDIAGVGSATVRVLDVLKADPLFAATDLVLETGRYLIGEAGVFITRVVRKKHSRGTHIGICDGGMNQHLAATGHFGAAMQRNYQMFKLATEASSAPEVAYTLVGPLCTTIDTLGRQVKLPALDAGDLIGIRCSGAYGLTASPIHFISHTPAREIIVETVQGCLRTEDASFLCRPVGREE